MTNNPDRARALLALAERVEREEPSDELRIAVMEAMAAPDRATT
jgi:hypothetical protein